MRVAKSVLMVGFALAVAGGGGWFAYSRYQASQGPSFTAERFLRLCRPQMEAEIKARKLAKETELAQATGGFLYAKAPTEMDHREKQVTMEDAHAALDELRLNGVWSKASYLSQHADAIGRMKDTGAVNRQIEEVNNALDDTSFVERYTELCMLKAKLAELEGTPVGDEHAGVPLDMPDLPLMPDETRVAFQNGCGAVMPSSASKSALSDTAWLGACNFGLAHGPGFRSKNGAFTPVTYFYGFDITTGKPGGDGAPGAMTEITARFKPLETARLARARAMMAAGGNTSAKDR